MQEPIPVAFISDDGFVMPTCVAIASLLKNKAPDTVYDIHVVMPACSADSRAQIQALPGVSVIETTSDAYAAYQQTRHISRATFLKFDLPELMEAHDKILYIDGEMLVREDLTALYETPLGDKYAAAVLDCQYCWKQRDHYNAGLMLLNAKLLRELHMREALLSAWEQDTTVSLGEQDVFNAVFAGRYAPLHIRYNCSPKHLPEYLRTYPLSVLNERYGTAYSDADELVADAAILHFAAEQKPWLYRGVPCGEEWMGYYRLSPYRDVPLKRKSQLRRRFDVVVRGVRRYGPAAPFVYLRDSIRARLPRR